MSRCLGFYYKIQVEEKGKDDDNDDDDDGDDDDVNDNDDDTCWAFNNYRQPMKSVAHFSQRSWLFFSQNKSHTGKIISNSFSLDSNQLPTSNLIKTPDDMMMMM